MSRSRPGLALSLALSLALTLALNPALKPALSLPSICLCQPLYRHIRHLSPSPDHS
jgi:hypothetical protein